VIALDLETDPVASGFVAILARPGGNITGVFLDFPEFSAKCLQLLIESVQRWPASLFCGTRPRARCSCSRSRPRPRDLASVSRFWRLRLPDEVDEAAVVEPLLPRITRIFGHRMLGGGEKQCGALFCRGVGLSRTPRP
jgi:hypothetical protein